MRTKETIHMKYQALSFENTSPLWCLVLTNSLLLANISRELVFPENMAGISSKSHEASQDSHFI